MQNRIRLYGAVTKSFAVISFLLSDAFAQEPASPTSVSLSQSFTMAFSDEQKMGPAELVSPDAHSDFLLSLRYDAPEGAVSELTLHQNHRVVLPAGENRHVEIACEHDVGKPARLRVWHEGLEIGKAVDIPGSARGGREALVASPMESAEVFRMDRDFTAFVRFRTNARGTLVAKAPSGGEWKPDAKALFVRGGRLVYDIGWLGSLQGRTRVDDDKEHAVVIVMEGGTVRIYLDGKLEAQRKKFVRPDKGDHVFKIGAAADNFGGDFEGVIANVSFWKRALGKKELLQLTTEMESTVNTPDFNWMPIKRKGELDELGKGPATVLRLKLGMGVALKGATVQALEAGDHRALVGSWNGESLQSGKAIYEQHCVTCHGTAEKPGSLPTATRFHEGQFRNGNDPYRMFQTLDRGYGMMVPQPQYSTKQKYDVIHYLRETFLKELNPSQYVELEDDYLSALPRGRTLELERDEPHKVPQYALQDFGDVLFWTLQVGPGNIAQKGIAFRVDEGPGGVSKGKAWMLYDHDTMRLAACWTGNDFVDWRGIAFDGSHGTHTSIVGDKRFVFPNEPMWANPATGEFEDLRILGRDGRPYGPLPREWVKFEGLHMDESLVYTVGPRRVIERPRLREDGSFARQLAVGPSKTSLELKVAADQIYRIPASAEWTNHLVLIKDGVVRAVPEGASPEGEPVEGSSERRFPGVLLTRIERGTDDGPFAVDVLHPPSPAENPWESWMRTTGFDFFEDGKSAAVCTWNGDVWIVDGIDQAEGNLQWQRICAGLFQPLGLKIMDGEIYVGCRDMIAKLIDRDGDRETDHIECFNNDHQVTEHFHEFAMGLQTDEEGNFYYAKSARHALKAVVPHHGTLLRVSQDGSRTDVLATGFRAANGICLNPDGTFVVTDQEGHWNPKNRINWVKGEGVDDFYGNMYGYHGVTDESDAAMVPPLCWITNRFDRSPAELLWVPEDSAWESLRGSLLNLSYGYGKVYVVPHEKVGTLVQGGMCELPLPPFPTGVMRGRFHPGDGQLYACGMYAWAGSQQQPGGFYRIRATGKPAHAPVGLVAANQTVTLTFTDALDRESAINPSAWIIEAWDLKRTKQYGSKHFNTRSWQVEKVKLSEDGKIVTLTIPDLTPTWGMSIQCEIRGAKGEEVKREIHNSIHTLN